MTKVTSNGTFVIKYTNIMNNTTLHTTTSLLSAAKPQGSDRVGISISKVNTIAVNTSLDIVLAGIIIISILTVIILR